MSDLNMKQTVEKILGCDNFNTRILNGGEQYDIEKISYSIANNPQFNLKDTNNLSIMAIDDTELRHDVIEELSLEDEEKKEDKDRKKEKDMKVDIIYKLSINNFYTIEHNGCKYIVYLTKDGVRPVRIRHKVDFYISIYFFFIGDNKPFEDLCRMCHLYYEKHFLKLENESDTLNIYLKGEYGYDKTNTIKQKSVDTLYLPKKDTTNLMKDVEEFIGNEEIYKHLDINYKRCYLFEGVWGSGKTSTIRTIASKFKYNIAIIAFDATLTDTKFFDGLRDLPKKSILVLEDIDCLFQERKKNDEMKNMITFSSLLNALDGMLSKHGLITVMTTNFKIHLDKALIRPGRVDYILHFDFIKKSEMKAMFMRFIYVNEDINKEKLLNESTCETKIIGAVKSKELTTKEDKDKTFISFYDVFKDLNIQITASLLQQYLWKYINKPYEVVENVDEIKELYDQTNLETEKNLYT